MTMPDHSRKQSAHRALLERQVLGFHYDWCARQGEPAFSPATLTEALLPGGIGLVLLASRGTRLAAVYAFQATDIGYRFRRLSTELEGSELRKEVLAAPDACPLGLARLGLSFREIEAVTQLDRRELGERLGGL